MAEKNKEPTIEQTLAELGIPTDLPPEEAAASASASVAESLRDDPRATRKRGKAVIQVEDDPIADIPPPQTEVEDELFREDDTPLVQDPADASLPSTDAGPGPLLPQPKPPRPMARQKSPVASKLGKGLADKVPGAEKVKVYKRDMGKRWFVNDYNKDDLAQFPDFESFLTRYVKPEHGPGEYDLVGVDGLGREMELGQVRLIPSPKDRSTPETGVVQFAAQIAEQSRQEVRELRQMFHQQPQPNMMELLQGVFAMKKEIEGSAEGGTAAMAKAMSESASSANQMMMTMMMQMQQQSQQQMQMMMQMQSENTKMLVSMLTASKREESGNFAAPPPPPPPPPQMDWPALIMAISTAAGTILSAIASSKGGKDEFKDFMQQLLLQQRQEQLSMKDVIALLQQKSESSGPGELQAAVDNMAMVMGLAEKLSRNNEPGAAAGLWDALASLFGNRDFAGGIANAIRSKTEASRSVEEQRLIAERQRLEQQQRLLQRERAQLAAMTQSQGQQTAPAPQQTPQTPVSAPTDPSAPVAIPTSLSIQKTETDELPDPEQAQKAAEQLIADNGLPALPADTHVHIRRLNAAVLAGDDAKVAEALVQFLIYFTEYEEWQGIAEQILEAIREGNKKGTQKNLKNLLSGLGGIKMVSRKVANHVLKVAIEHIDVFQQHLAELPLSRDESLSAAIAES
jgi:phosphoribosyl-ATP pyrophosphohydrolase